MRALKIIGILVGAILILVFVGEAIETNLTQKRNAAEQRELKVFFDDRPNKPTVLEFLNQRGYTRVYPYPVDDYRRSSLVEDGKINAENVARAVEYIQCFKPLGGEGFFFGRSVHITALFDSSGSLVQDIVESHIVGP